MSLHRRSNDKKITKSGLSSVTSEVDADDPLLEVKEDIIERVPYTDGRTPDDDQRTTLAFRKGERVRKSVLLARIEEPKDDEA